MSANVFDRVRENLSEKRQSLVDWLDTTPPEKRQVRLGSAGDGAVRCHLDVLDMAIDKAERGTLGICTVCHGHIETELLEMDYTANVCLEHLSGEDARRLESELELAQTMQRSLMPQQVPHMTGLEISAFSRPAQIIGGDYFDFVRFQDGAHGLAIADVAGHGISAGLGMASVQALLRTLVTASDSPADVARRMHHLLIHNVQFSTFVTLFLGAFDPATHTLTYCNAGHNPPLLVRHGTGSADGGLSWLWPTGAAIGMVEEFAFTEATLHLWPGDLLVLYTDGATEAFNSDHQPFGRESLAQAVWQARDSSPKELIRVIRQELDAFSGGLAASDDLTLVVCRVTD